MPNASSAARSCDVGALLLLAVLAFPGLSQGSDVGAGLTATPTVTFTAPADGAVQVNLTDPIQVNFSEAMNPSTLYYAILPNVTLTVSWLFPDVLQLLPDPPGLTNCTLYRVQVAANATSDGSPLVPGPVPNPWSFLTSCDRPYVVATSPADGADNVPADADLVITFSEPMNCLASPLDWLPSAPTSGVTSCPTNTTLRFRLTGGSAYLPGTTYTVTVTLTDVDGNALVDSPVPNPWTFTVNAPPTVSEPLLSASGCLDSGSSLLVSWSMGDDLDAPENLTVRLTYLNGSVWETITGPSTGFPASASYAWTLPYADLATRVRVEARDSVGVLATNESASFRVDTGPPRILSTTPADGAQDVSLGSSITIVFSEAMDRASVAAALSSVPALPGMQFLWDPGDEVLTLSPGGMPDLTTFRITIARTALDTCGPGRAMGADHAFTFTTGRAAPSPPSRLEAIVYYETSVTLAWDPVTTFVTGRPIPANATVRYLVFRGNATDLGRLVTETTETHATDAGLQPSTEYAYRVVAVVDGEASQPTAPLFAKTLDPLFQTNAGRISLGVALAAVVAALLVGAQMRRARRRRKAKAQLTAEIQQVVEQVRRVRTEPDPQVRRREEKALQARFASLVKGGGEETEEGFRPDPRLEGLYRALAQALVRSPEVDVARGRAIVDKELGSLAQNLRGRGAAYRLLSEAEASVRSALFPTLPESARKALLLVYFYGLEDYLSNRLRALVPAGSTLLLGERGHINVRRRGWEAQWAGLTLGNLLYMMGHNAHFFVADADAWAKEVQPILRQAVEARNRTAHPSREAPPLEKVRELVYGAIPAVESVLKWPKAS